MKKRTTLIALMLCICALAASAAADFSVPEGTHLMSTNGAYLNGALVLPNGHLLMTGGKSFLVEVAADGNVVFRLDSAGMDESGLLYCPGMLSDGSVVFQQFGNKNGEEHVEMGTLRSADGNTPLAITRPLGSFSLPPELLETPTGRLYFGEEGIFNVITNTDREGMPEYIFYDLELNHVFTVSIPETGDIRVLDAVVATDGIVVYGVRDMPDGTMLNVMFKLDMSGGLMWQQDVSSEWTHALQMSAMPDGGIVITAMNKGETVALRLDLDGQIMWKHSYGMDLYPSDIFRLDEGSLVLCAAENNRYAECRLLCLDDANGTILGTRIITGDSENSFLSTYVAANLQGGAWLYGLHVPRYGQVEAAEAFYLKLSPETFAP